METKTQSQSSTIRAAVRSLVISGVTLYLLFSGDVIDQAQVDKWANYASIAALFGYQFWETRNVVKGRAKADTPVEIQPWHKEAVNFIKGAKK